jgi:hypothetical protein
LRQNVTKNANNLCIYFIITGDGSTNAIQRPRLVAALQGKKINRVACGSAHTLAWSTNKPVATSKLPTAVPLEYDILQDMSPTLLRNRLVLLHHFSDIFCPGIAMFPLGFSVRLIFNLYDCLNLSEKIFRKLQCDID